MNAPQALGSRVSRTIRRLAVPILLVWIGIAALTNIAVPTLEEVGKEHNVALSSPSFPSLQAMKHIGAAFHSFDSDSTAMVVLEGDGRLGDSAHQFYNTLVRKLEHDTKHIEHIEDFWGDPLTAAGSQSNDGKAAYVELYLRGNQGEPMSLESVDAVRDIVAHTPAPPGVKAYVAGAAPVITDQFELGAQGALTTTLATVVVIALMLLWVYRSLVTMIVVLLTVIVELSAARGIVAAMGNYGLIGLSTYSTNLLTLLVLAAGTDYAIFFLGRYHEARHAGEDREVAYHSMFRGTAHVVLGSGATVAGAVLCLSFCRNPYFQTLGVPAGIGILITLMAALTLAPAVVVIAGRFGLLEPKRILQTRGWRRIGAAIVRWPAPILTASVAVALIGLLALPGYQTSYNAQDYMPPTAPANVGYAAADRHFSKARLNPELLMIEADHDLRNPADMINLERVAKSIFHTHGIAKVQSMTRPLGTPIEHTSLAFQISAGSIGNIENLQYQKDRADDLMKQANVLKDTIGILNRQYTLQKDLAASTHDETQSFHDTVAVVNDLRDKIANFDDFFRPIRSYFYWEKHCYDIPVCFALRSVFDALDGIDELAEQFTKLTASLDQLDTGQQKLVTLLPPQIADQEKNLELTLSNFATNAGTNAQTRASTDTATALGQAYDAAKNDDSFYFPPEAFDNPELQRGLKLFLTPDGKAARMIITHDVDPATPAGIAHVDSIRDAAREAVKGTPLDGSKIYLAGTAATYKDIHDVAEYDLMIAALAALSLILLIMMVITRSIIAALVIVGTVALSLGASFGLSVLIWQDLLGIKLYWIVLALSIIILLAVGSDYNLLLISRFKEEIGAGLKTGVIRSIAGSGSVVTSAGLVFALTMCSFVISDLQMLGQIGTTIGLGLLFDTLIVRSFMTPSIATLLGRWFWWPQHVRPRPASTMLRPYGPRPAVRQLLLWGDEDMKDDGALL